MAATIAEDLAFLQNSSKIGLSRPRSMPNMGSNDALNKVLTIVQFGLPAEPQPYVNSKWAIREFTYAGDARNSYNVGAPELGALPLGPFCELESS